MFMTQYILKMGARLKILFVAAGEPDKDKP